MKYIKNYNKFILNETYDEAETYEEKIITEKGLEIIIKVTKFPKINNNIAAEAFLYENYNSDNLPVNITSAAKNNSIAEAQFYNLGNNKYYATFAGTNNSLRRNGIMSSIYNFIEKKFNIIIVQSKYQEPDGIKFWNKRMNSKIF
jgi:hypothetical protein